jgi:hypothetical protein
MAHGDRHYLEVGEPYGMSLAHLFPQTRRDVRRARRTAGAQDRSTLLDETGQLLNVVAVFVADQHRVNICHGESDGG